jgi:hypothetical protein
LAGRQNHKAPLKVQDSKLVAEEEEFDLLIDDNKKDQPISQVLKD